MKGKTLERWQELCEQAAVERDPICLMELIAEINQLLEEKEQRLRKERVAESKKLLTASDELLDHSSTKKTAE